MCVCMKGTDKGKRHGQMLGVLREVTNFPVACLKYAGKMSNRHGAEDLDLSWQLRHYSLMILDKLHDFGQAVTISSIE